MPEERDAIDFGDQMLEKMKKEESFPGDHQGLSSHTLIENQMADMSTQFIHKIKGSNE